ncbi:MAG: cupin domain-containing protein [Chloroflexota bacterium]|nr:cupin domain-containing protein [Chloroflexota bacterium]MDE2886177.1 cupin domain-containing protein [Chloroflexota bacterium]
MSWTMPESERAYHQELDDENINPLWIAHANPPERPRLAPHVWRWDRMRELAIQAGELESLKGQGFRRALTMRNPGLKNPQAGATKTMSAAVQIVWPGEIAEAHRHTAAAIRFVIEGEGAFTVQDGERFRMQEGDLVLSPSWAWHDHNNPTDKPVIWLDCLDAPLVGYLDAMFQEPFPEDVQPVTKPVGFTNASIGNGLMRPRLEDVHGGALPLTYRWDEAYGALLGYGEEDPFDGVIMEYANPVTGGHSMPTLALKLQRLAPGSHTEAHRHTSSVVYHVAKGEGYSIIDGKRLDWSRADTFVLPPWALHEHGTDSSEDAVLFSMSDLPVIEAIGLYREEEGKRQEVVGAIA